MSSHRFQGFVFAMTAALAGGCQSGPEEAQVDEVFNPCGRLTIVLEGQVGSRTFSGRQGSLLEAERTVTFSVPVGATGTGLDAQEVQMQASVAETGREFNATVSAGRSDLQIAGTVEADCSASGSWALLDPSNGRLRGLGSWTTR